MTELEPVSKIEDCISIENRTCFPVDLLADENQRWRCIGLARKSTHSALVEHILVNIEAYFDRKTKEPSWSL